MRITVSNRLQAVLAYTTTTLLPLVLVTVLMRLWRTSLDIPLIYMEDGLFNSALVKGMLDNGWLMHNPFLGAPGEMDLYDFPMPDNLHFVLLKLVTAIFPSYPKAFNVFYLVGFPLIATSSLLALRQLGLSYGPSIIVSILYSLLPYHFYRNLNHIFLSCYYTLPLMVLACVWLSSGKHLKDNISIFDNFNLKDINISRCIFISIIGILLASSGIYYAFFGCFFLFVIMIDFILREVPLKQVLFPAFLVMLIIVFTALNVTPSIQYRRQHGKNREVAHRLSCESEMYGLKIIQLVLPISGHRIPSLAKLRDRYDRSFPLVNENYVVSLGIVGSVGFLALLGIALFRCRGEGQDVLGRIQLFNVSAVLLGTIGGFGAVFALLISPKIRAYNRISVYISFFSLLAVGIFLERLRKHRAFHCRQALFRLLLIVILLVGIFDQTSDVFVPDYISLARQFEQDEEFVHRVEASVPPGAMIYQLPYVPFPESPPVERMRDYEHLRGYLHSRGLRWSYGAVKGRKVDLWLRELAEKPLEMQVAAIADKGFSGVYVDNHGFADGGEGIRAELEKVVDANPLVSRDRRLVFFPLRSATDRLNRE